MRAFFLSVFIKKNFFICNLSILLYKRSEIIGPIYELSKIPLINRFLPDKKNICDGMVKLLLTL